MTSQKGQELTFWDILRGAPAYLINYVVGLLLGGLTDLTITSTFFASVALALATNVYWAVAFFFVIHIVVRIVNAVNSAIVTNGRLAGQGALAVATALQPQDHNRLALDPKDPGPPAETS
jgi:hypothetical protein